MSLTIECSWEEFKRMAKEFHMSAPTLNQDELENAWKCFGLGYLGMNECMWENSAAILYQMESKTYFNRLFSLT